MKRIKRKHLKQDEFVSTINKVINFVKKRYRMLVAACGVVILVVLIIIGIKIVQAQSVKRDSRLLANILEISEALKEDPDKISELENLAGQSKFARLGYIKLAAYWIEEGDPEKARTTLEKIPGERKDIIYYQAQDMLAQIHMQHEEYDKAIQILEKIEEKNPKNYTLDIVLFHKAQALEGKGEIAAALDVYSKIQEEYPQTFYGVEASQKVSELEEKK